MATATLCVCLSHESIIGFQVSVSLLNLVIMTQYCNIVM